MISKAERHFGTIIPVYKYLSQGKTVSKDSRVKIIGGSFYVGSFGTVTGFKGLGKVWVRLDSGELKHFESRFLEGV